MTRQPFVPLVPVTDADEILVTREMIRGFLVFEAWVRDVDHTGISTRSDLSDDGATWRQLGVTRYGAHTATGDALDAFKAEIPRAHAAIRRAFPETAAATSTTARLQLPAPESASFAVARAALEAQMQLLVAHEERAREAMTARVTIPGTPAALSASPDTSSPPATPPAPPEPPPR